MEHTELERIRQHKYNNWGERLPLIGDLDLIEQAKILNLGSGKRVQSAIYTHKLTGCKGFEFVAFSSAKIDQPIQLPYGLILYPCFIPQLAGTQIDDPIATATSRMQQNGRYVYDGWLPIDTFDEVEVAKRLRCINEALSVFYLVSQSYFEWEPKYYALSPTPTTEIIDGALLKTIEAFVLRVNGLSGPDRKAIFRSIAWLAQAGKTDDVKASFLFMVLAIESLATYIERTASSESALATLQIIETNSKMRRIDPEACVVSILNELVSDPIKAVNNAYQECINTNLSISRLLKEHLTELMGEQHEGVLRFFNKEDGLYKLRNKIAHGGLDNLAEEDVVQLEMQIHYAREFALQYVWAVLQKSLDFYNQSDRLEAVMTFDMMNVILSCSKMYKGPAEMAILYTR